MAIIYARDPGSNPGGDKFQFSRIIGKLKYSCLDQKKGNPGCSLPVEFIYVSIYIHINMNSLARNIYIYIFLKGSKEGVHRAKVCVQINHSKPNITCPMI